MKKKILSVGLEIPGGEVDHVDGLSTQSLLDADIIVYSPSVPRRLHGYYGGESYRGKPCLSDDESFRATEAIAHWRRELLAATDAGKLVVVLLKAPEIVFVATGQKTYSGTGRNARTTRHVEELSSYRAIPVDWEFHAASGVEMSLVPQARFLAPYWAEFSEYSKYEAYLSGNLKEPLVKTKTGDRVISAAVRRGKGGLIALPALDFDKEDFFETSDDDGDAYWTEEAKTFGRRLSSALVALAEAIASEVQATPAPSWALDNAYRLSDEANLEAQIAEKTLQVQAIEAARGELEGKLRAAGTLRGLLFEQGKPLEAAVLEALSVLGFQAQRVAEADSEFDVIFVSQEGRFLGEVEGKDNKPISIDKLSQLERNLNEDFSRPEVAEYAKGVLFGNAHRLKPPAERPPFFTEKCITGATRRGVALVSTPDLFEPARYLKDHKDLDYAAACRGAILSTSGEIVVFRTPPNTREAREDTLITDLQREAESTTRETGSARDENT